jgi:4-hydroxybenzoate polyprenyltransferase
LLARVSNLPTVWTNVLAGLIVSGANLDVFVPLASAASLFYTGGMFLNDAFDASIDARERPERPIPAGDIARGEAFAAGAALLMAGEGALLLTPHRAPAMVWGAVLAAAIVFYDFRHKQQAYGPVIMGLCRALVYVVAAAAAGALGSAIALPVVLMWSYVIAVTEVAKRAGPRAGVVVPLMIAGIALVDGMMMFSYGPPWTGVAAMAAFLLTLALQRVVPGT